MFSREMFYARRRDSILHLETVQYILPPLQELPGSILGQRNSDVSFLGFTPIYKWSAAGFLQSHSTIQLRGVVHLSGVISNFSCYVSRRGLVWRYRLHEIFLARTLAELWSYEIPYDLRNSIMERANALS